MLIGTTDLNTTLNLTYVLTDVVETLLLDMRSEMKKQGYDLRHDAKHNFNTAIAAIRRLKQDVDKTQFSTQENFGNDSDCLLAFIKLLIDRCGDDDKEEVAEKLAKCGMVVVQDETFYVEPKKEDQAS
ncbi:host-nuclease inhibitor Gam family protein [Bacteroides faecis]|uniref:host-nuclease inhibitor Gam family protein n=1 Tax=Bacteroides faecis TaxID=674529 RepID=UPI001E296F76|nr:host-nuclease inhibitor Gam family protein [Bacteroides faecis]